VSGGRLNLPDGLALFRMVMTVPIMALVRADEEQIPAHFVIAAVLFAVTSATDYLDGYLARRSTGGEGTVLGAFLDTTADKILVTGVLLALVSVGHVSVWPAAVIVFREFTVMALRGVVAQGGGLIKPSTWGKAKAVSQYLAIFLAFLRLPGRWGPWYLDQYVMAIAVIATIGSMWGYMKSFWSVIRSETLTTRRS
jgi:CDP-diacylglycerol--glycerol-3-phosphate 3-phosphatidyltransferase